MIVEIELYRDTDGKKYVYIGNSGGSGAKYEYETPEDIGKHVAAFLDYFPDVVENPPEA